MTTSARSSTTVRLALAAAAAALAMLALLLLDPARSDAAGARRTVVSTVNSNLGRILVDARGRTLYLFEKDKHGMSACDGSCAAYWPPLLASGKVVAALGGVKASMLGTTRRADGRLQVIYNHHPLYTFVGDMKKGQTNGQDSHAFGAGWYVLSPAGKKIEKDDQ